MPVINGVYLKDFTALPSSVTDANIIPIAITGNQIAYRTTVGGIVTDARVTSKLLTGLSVTGGAIAATDTILAAFGKVQNQINSKVSSVGLTMPSAFNVANSPITSSGTLAVTAAGVASQYIRGDGALADFPTSGGGGSSVSYYLNGSVNQGTFVGNTYYEMNKTPVIGTGTDFTINANGYIAQFITDANDPASLLIPGGNWNVEMYFSASSSGGTPSFYVEVYKYNGTTFSLLGTSSASPEGITNGTAIDIYYTSVGIPETVLTITDRLAIRVYVTHSGRTITLHTEDNHLSEIVTTFSNGLTALNGLTKQAQYFAVDTTGTDFNISSSVDTHTFNLPTASASNRGALSSADWTTFNNKAAALSGTINTIAYWNSATTIASLALATYPSLTELSYVKGVTSAIQTQLNAKQATITLTTTGTSGAATFISNTLNIPNYADGGVLSLSAIGAVPNANAATITGTVLNLQPASASFGGVITTGTQTFAGDKTFTGNINASPTSGNAIQAITTSSIAISVQSTTGDGVQSSSTTGAAIKGSASGILGYAVVGQASGTGGAGGYFSGGSNATYAVFATATGSTTTALYATANSASYSVQRLVQFGAGAIAFFDNTSGTVATISNAGGLTLAGQLSLGSTITNGTYTYTLPSATGTLALTSALSGYLPLTGGTLTGALSGTSITLSGDYNSTSNSGSLLWSGATNKVQLNANAGTLDFYTGTSGYTKQLSIASTGAATFSGALSGTSATFSDNVTLSAAGTNKYIQYTNTYGSTVITNALNDNSYITGALRGEALILSGTVGKGLRIGNTADNVSYLSFASTGAATFSSSITSTLSSGVFLNNSSGGTNATQIRINNTGGDARAGVESSAGGVIQIGTLAYAAVFGNQANAATQFTTNGTARLTILGDGNVGIGTTSPTTFSGNTVVSINNAAGGAVLELQSNGTSAFRMATSSSDSALWEPRNVPILIATYNTERIRITPGGVLQMSNNSTTFSIGSIAGYQRIQYGTGGNTTEFAFINASDAYTPIGASAFNTRSDYRLKEDLKEFSGLFLINNMKVYDFKWKENEERNYGFMAHELQEVVPYVVTGTKDGIFEEEPQYQGMDTSKLIPVLVKAIQELKAEIDLLKGEPIVPEVTPETNNNLE